MHEIMLTDSGRFALVRLDSTADVVVAEFETAAEARQHAADNGLDLIEPRRV